jgi:protein-S-isoprenylcysteine O-methyltransferase Ste14
MILQKRKGIKPYKLGVGLKPRSAIISENVVHVLSYLIVFCQLLCIFNNYRIMDEFLIQIFGVFLGFFANGILIVSLLTMKDNWRAGMDENDRNIELITNGIYGSLCVVLFLIFQLINIK